MGVYQRAKFDVFSIILTGLDRGGNFIPPPPTSKRTLKKPTQIGVTKWCNLIGKKHGHKHFWPRQT